MQQTSNPVFARIYHQAQSNPVVSEIVERGRIRSHTYFVAPRTHPPLCRPAAHPHRICYTHVMRSSLRLAGSCSLAAGSPAIPAVGLASSRSRAEPPEREHTRGGRTCSVLLTTHRSEFVPRERFASAMRCGSTTPQTAIRCTNALPGRQTGKQNER